MRKAAAATVILALLVLAVSCNPAAEVPDEAPGSQAHAGSYSFTVSKAAALNSRQQEFTSDPSELMDDFAMVATGPVYSNEDLTEPVTTEYGTTGRWRFCAFQIHWDETFYAENGTEVTVIASISGLGPGSRDFPSKALMSSWGNPGISGVDGNLFSNISTTGERYVASGSIEDDKIWAVDREEGVWAASDPSNVYDRVQSSIFRCSFTVDKATVLDATVNASGNGHAVHDELFLDDKYVMVATGPLYADSAGTVEITQQSGTGRWNYVATAGGQGFDLCEPGSGRTFYKDAATCVTVIYAIYKGSSNGSLPSKDLMSSWGNPGASGVDGSLFRALFGSDAAVVWSGSDIDWQYAWYIDAAEGVWRDSGTTRQSTGNRVQSAIF